jgi:hypothetical protein
MDHAQLARQSLMRPLSADEQNLARALEAIFATGQHELGEVVRGLQLQGVKRPSGETGPWTLEVLEDELSKINEELDRLYLKSERGSA